MLILSIEEAQAGMTLAAPVLHPEHPDQELLRRGYVLEDAVIGRLRGMGVDMLYVDYPALDDLDRHLAPHLSPARQVMYTQVKKTISAVQRHTRAEVGFADYYACTREMVTTLLSQGQHPIYMDQMARMGSDMVGHCTAVAHLGLMLGLKLERYLIEERSRLSAKHARETVNIGVAGMLHDIGKSKLPEHLRDRHALDAPQDEEQRTEWESHSRISYDMVRSGIEASAASAVLHHHQHFDGTGFPLVTHRDGAPAPLEQKRIHIFARILMAADLYDRLTARLAADGKTRVRRTNLEILQLINSQYRQRFDPTVLQALRALCPPFPPGTRVGLSDGTAAVVVSVDAKDPCKPQVKRFMGEEWNLDSTPIAIGTDGAPEIVSVAGTPVRAEELVAATA